MIDEKQLIEVMERWKRTGIEEHEQSAFNLAIDLIKIQPIFGKWIPCSERLPKQSLNSVIGWDQYRERCVFVQYYMNEWILGNHESVNIVAWQPLPERYECHSKKLKKNSKGNKMTNLDEIKNYLDSCIVYWRKKRDEESCEFAKYYIDAFQSVRNSIFDELLDCRKGETE